MATETKQTTEQTNNINNMIGANVHCAGLIVFDHAVQNVVIVTTPHGNKGFPKGKRHKQEPLLKCAQRECQEESGLNPQDYHIPDLSLTLNEQKEHKKSISVRYWIAVTHKSCTKKLQCKNPLELQNVEWESIQNCLQDVKLCARRQYLLQQAFEFIKNQQSSIDQSTLDN